MAMNVTLGAPPAMTRSTAGSRFGALHPAGGRSATLAIAALFALAIAAAPSMAAPFTPGNLTVYRVGNGIDSLVNTGNPIFLDEYTPSGFLVQSIPLPTTASGSNEAIWASGTAKSEGLITRSADGRYLIVTGYASASTMGSLVDTSAATIRRVVGVIDAAGEIDTTTALSDFADEDNPRSAASVDGGSFWVAGGTGGIRHVMMRGATSELDLVVHCAGITRDGVLWKLDLEDWREVIDVNLSSAFLLLRGLTPLLRGHGRGGAIVLISSINGERGKFGQANYAASKAGLIALGKTAALELGRFGVRVNCVCPGFIETALTAKLPAQVRERAIAETVLGHPGLPADVADAALFFCSDMSRHVTGQSLRVDGGQLIA